MSQIEIKGVTYAYPLKDGYSVRAIKNVSFSIEKGEYVALVGMNGSGKSTLAKLLNGLFLPNEGEILIDGISTSDEKNAFEIRKRVGMVFQNPDNQTVATIVEDDVAFGPENIGLPREEIVSRVIDALAAVGMSDFANRSASKLSGGQKQRVAIAGVLAMKPEIVIFDESTSMLDPIGRREVLDVAAALNAQGITIINITHNMEEAALASRVIALRKGRIAIDGTPKEAFASGQLEACGLKLPPVAAVAARLKSEGFDLSDGIFDEAELVDEIYSDLRPFKEFSSEADEFANEEVAPTDREIASISSIGDGEDNAHESVAIDVKNLDYIYSKKTPSAMHALKEVSFAVREGEFVGIVGATGSGKSTLIQHFNGLIRVQNKKRSSVIVDGLDASKRKNFKDVRFKVGMVFQYPEYQLFADTVEKDVAFGPKNMKLSADEINSRVRRALEVVGLDYDKFATRSPFDLSGGEKRRVAIAGVIAMQPRILVLDEPVAGLDPIGRDEILALVKKLHAEVSPTVILVSHNMDDIALLADRIVALSDGRLVADGAPEDVFGKRAAIRDAGLEIPTAARIADALSQKGVILPTNIVTADELVRALCALREGKDV